MKLTTSQILNNLYGLMMDINYHQIDSDVLDELKKNHDPFVENHLMSVKRLIVKQKAAAHHDNVSAALDQLRQLKERGVEELKKLLTPEEHMEYAQLFRKFDGLSGEDEASILEDKQLLKLLERMRNVNRDDNRS